MVSDTTTLIFMVKYLYLYFFQIFSIMLTSKRTDLGFSPVSHKYGRIDDIKSNQWSGDNFEWNTVKKIWIQFWFLSPRDTYTLNIWYRNFLFNIVQILRDPCDNSEMCVLVWSPVTRHENLDLIKIKSTYDLGIVLLTVYLDGCVVVRFTIN